MKHTYAFILYLLFSQYAFSASTNYWKKNNTNEIRQLLSFAAKQDKSSRLSLVEMYAVFGEQDYIELKDLIIKGKTVYPLRGSKQTPTPTKELVWLLSNKRILQVVVVESFIVYAYIINDSKQRELVWK